jgi:hypothetical protein
LIIKIFKIIQFYNKLKKKKAWRKIFESSSNGKIDFVLWGTNEAVVITGKGKRVQSFNYANGFANWEYVLFGETTVESE